MTDTPSKRSSPLNILVQVVGVLAGLAALTWCVWLAFKPENRESLSRLREITWLSGGLIALLTVISFSLNGLCFWSTLRAEKALKPIDVIATNSLSMFLALLPFKVSLIFRVLIHNRRDGVPLLTIGAWFTAVGVGMLLVLGPIIGATVLRKQIDPIWLSLVLLGIPVLSALVISLARWAAGPVGLARVQKLAARFPTAAPARIAASKPFAQFHSGFAMIGSHWFIANLAFRAFDVAVQAARFHVIASIMHVHVSFAFSILLPSTYFLIGVLAPSGTAGSREGGSTWIAKLLSITNWQAIASVCLTIGACELIVELLLAPFALLILKPWKFFSSSPRV